MKNINYIPKQNNSTKNEEVNAKDKAQISTVSSQQFLVKEYNQFFKDTNQIKLEQTKNSLLAHNILYNQRNKIKMNKELQIIDLKTTTTGEIIWMKISLGPFIMDIQLFQKRQQSQVHLMHKISQGSYGSIYQLKFHNKQFVCKCLSFKITQKNVSQQDKVNQKWKIIIAAIKQYIFNKVFSALQIGPAIPLGFGFNIIIYPSCVQFVMQKCISTKQPQIQTITEHLKHALKKLHALQIVHRDIKPQNILFSPTYNKYIFCDMGICEYIVQPLGFKTFTRFRGTFNYASPQLKKLFYSDQADNIDLYYNDIFSLRYSFSFLQKVFMKKLLVKKTLTLADSSYQSLFIKYLIFNMKLQLINQYKSEFNTVKHQILDFLTQVFPDQSLRCFYRKYYQYDKRFFNYQIEKIYGKTSILTYILPKKHWKIIKYENILNKFIGYKQKRINIKCYTKLKQMMLGQQQLQLTQQDYMFYYSKYMADTKHTIKQKLQFSYKFVQKIKPDLLVKERNEWYGNAFVGLSIAQQYSIQSNNKQILANLFQCFLIYFKNLQKCFGIYSHLIVINDSQLYKLRILLEIYLMNQQNQKLQFIIKQIQQVIFFNNSIHQVRLIIISLMKIILLKQVVKFIQLLQTESFASLQRQFANEKQQIDKIKLYIQIINLKIKGCQSYELQIVKKKQKFTRVFILAQQINLKQFTFYALFQNAFRFYLSAGDTMKAKSYMTYIQEKNSDKIYCQYFFWLVYVRVALINKNQLLAQQIFKRNQKKYQKLQRKLYYLIIVIRCLTTMAFTPKKNYFLDQINQMLGNSLIVEQLLKSDPIIIRNASISVVRYYICTNTNNKLQMQDKLNKLQVIFQYEYSNMFRGEFFVKQNKLKQAKQQFQIGIHKIKKQNTFIYVRYLLILGQLYFISEKKQQQLKGQQMLMEACYLSIKINFVNIFILKEPLQSIIKILTKKKQYFVNWKLIQWLAHFNFQCQLQSIYSFYKKVIKSIIQQSFSSLKQYIPFIISSQFYKPFSTYKELSLFVGKVILFTYQIENKNLIYKLLSQISLTLDSISNKSKKNINNYYYYIHLNLCTNKRKKKLLNKIHCKNSDNNSKFNTLIKAYKLKDSNNKYMYFSKKLKLLQNNLNKFINDY